MLILLRKMMNSAADRRPTSTVPSYEEALKALHTLQSNAAFLQSVTQKIPQQNLPKLYDTEKYLLRSGITLENLDKLSVIHVAGTKGKGSSCAFTESILRKHGYNTGFFSSPHLVSVRERIRINGQPLSHTLFSRYFWRVFKQLDDNKEHESDMPTYFKFLTILMFHVFLEENVDVAIIEVGIGGKSDCTNIIRNPVCVGITSLGLEHTSLLGNTIQEIAFEKSGIFKPKTAAFTVPQVPEAMSVLENRAVEKNCTLCVVPQFGSYIWTHMSPILDRLSEIQQQNASLAIQMAMHWIFKEKANVISTYNRRGKILQDNKENVSNKLLSFDVEVSKCLDIDKVAVALSSCKWPGRMQIMRSTVANFFLDGAHTLERERDPVRFLKLLQTLEFDRVYFVPNYAGIKSIDDVTNCTGIEEQMVKCEKHAEFWGEGAIVFNSVYNALQNIKKQFDTKISSTDDNRAQVLVTGSLHLVGAVLTVLDPNLTMHTKF